jgi:molybdopterin/thiamine biosynthesis adenylyltransferase
MPDMLLGSGSMFDRTKSALAHWLRNNLEAVHSLAMAAMGICGPQFVAGWSAEIAHKGEKLVLHVLLDGQFPYTHIRIVLKSKDVYLKWPHVQRGGLLCLPRLAAAVTNLEAVIAATIDAALRLIENCANPDYVTAEFRREFVSYWSRGEHNKAKTVFSLLDSSDQRARITAVWFGKLFTLVGETPDQVRNWCKNRFGDDGAWEIAEGIFGFLDQAPAPPFPELPVDLFTLLAGHSPEAAALFDALPIEERVAVVLGADSPTGVGLIAMRIERPRLNGFRKGKAVNAATKATLWKCRQLKRESVERIDSAWVHGRGHNKEQPVLERSSVLLLGCGSLGSQVAVRLAQSGVGTMRLVDPQPLEPANVGRHALGIDSVPRSKARALAAELQRRFPHMRAIEGFSETWQAVLAKRPEIFEQASLIVACLGEWGADGQLGEWQAQCGRPIVYGWLDEEGVAAHALALPGSTPALTCILDEDGNLRVPETEWVRDGLIQAEPACGTLFQPYGALDVAHAEVLVSRLCIDFLTGSAKPPVHRVHAGSTAQIVEAGGTWSKPHLSKRPVDFAGPFVYERPIEACGACTVCTEVT